MTYRKWTKSPANLRRLVNKSDYRVKKDGNCHTIYFRPTGQRIHSPKCLTGQGAKNQLNYDMHERNSQRWWYMNKDGSWKKFGSASAWENWLKPKWRQWRLKKPTVWNNLLTPGLN